MSLVKVKDATTGKLLYTQYGNGNLQAITLYQDTKPISIRLINSMLAQVKF